MEPMSIASNRAPRDHLEVRCAESHRLLGWLTGIAAKEVPHAPLQLTDPDDERIVEDEDGQNVLPGLTYELDTAEFEHTFVDFRTHEALEDIRAQVPSYARRTKNAAAGTVIYTWVAVMLDAQELETVFDFDNFEPYGREDAVLVADEVLFHAEALLKNAREGG